MVNAPARHRIGATLVVAVLVVSCTTGGPPPSPGGSPETPSLATQPVPVTSVPTVVEHPKPECEGSGGTPWQTTAMAKLEVLMEEDGVLVKGVVYPHPDYKGNPWSQWGQGIALADGRYLSAIGDHLGPDGNSFVYEFDPATSELRQIIDVRSQIDHVAGEWGFGKVHAQMVAGPCDDVYFATYWGSRNGLAYTDTYQGDRIFRIEPIAETVEDLGVVYSHRGIPSLASSPSNGLVFAEAVDPKSSPNQGEFVVFDLTAGKVVFTDATTGHVGFRAMAVDEDGRAYFSKGEQKLAVYDPSTNAVTDYPGTLPGGWLRAATAPAPDGTIYAVTREPDAFFSMTSAGRVTELGPAPGYVASMVVDPTGETVYFAPYAHGGSYMRGGPLMAMDTATGEQRVVVALNDAAEEVLGVRLGGTYNLAISPDGRTLYLGMNAAPLSTEGGFGEVVLLVIELPG